MVNIITQGGRALLMGGSALTTRYVAPQSVTPVSSIALTPLVLSIPDNLQAGSVIGTLSRTGGKGDGMWTITFDGDPAIAAKVDISYPNIRLTSAAAATDIGTHAFTVSYSGDSWGGSPDDIERDLTVVDHTLSVPLWSFEIDNPLTYNQAPSFSPPDLSAKKVPFFLGMPCGSTPYLPYNGYNHETEHLVVSSENGAIVAGESRHVIDRDNQLRWVWIAGVAEPDALAGGQKMACTISKLTGARSTGSQPTLADVVTADPDFKVSVRVQWPAFDGPITGEVVSATSWDAFDQTFDLLSDGGTEAYDDDQNPYVRVIKKPLVVDFDLNVLLEVHFYIFKSDSGPLTSANLVQILMDVQLFHGSLIDPDIWDIFDASLTVTIGTANPVTLIDEGPFRLRRYEGWPFANHVNPSVNKYKPWVTLLKYYQDRPGLDIVIRPETDEYHCVRRLIDSGLIPERPTLEHGASWSTVYDPWVHASWGINRWTPVPFEDKVLISHYYVGGTGERNDIGMFTAYTQAAVIDTRNDNMCAAFRAADCMRYFDTYMASPDPTFELGMAGPFTDEPNVMLTYNRPDNIMGMYNHGQHFDGGYGPEFAHYPEPYSIPYWLSGRLIYLEQALNNINFALFMVPGGPGMERGMFENGGQIRSFAWEFSAWSNMLACLPDSWDGSWVRQPDLSRASLEAFLDFTNSPAPDKSHWLFPDPPKTEGRPPRFYDAFVTHRPSGSVPPASGSALNANSWQLNYLRQAVGQVVSHNQFPKSMAATLLQAQLDYLVLHDPDQFWPDLFMEQGYGALLYDGVANPDDPPFAYSDSRFTTPTRFHRLHLQGYAVKTSPIVLSTYDYYEGRTVTVDQNGLPAHLYRLTVSGAPVFLDDTEFYKNCSPGHGFAIWTGLDAGNNDGLGFISDVEDGNTVIVDIRPQDCVYLDYEAYGYIPLSGKAFTVPSWNDPLLPVDQRGKGRHWNDRPWPNLDGARSYSQRGSINHLFNVIPTVPENAARTVTYLEDRWDAAQLEGGSNTTWPNPTGNNPLKYVVLPKRSLTP